jgi:hypothetical protein
LNVTHSFTVTSTLHFADRDIWRLAVQIQLAVAAVYVTLLPRPNFLDQQFLSAANLQFNDFFILRDRQDISLVLWREFSGGGKNLVCSMCAMTLKMQKPDGNVLLPNEAVSTTVGSGSKKGL